MISIIIIIMAEQITPRSKNPKKSDKEVQLREKSATLSCPKVLTRVRWDYNYWQSRTGTTCNVS